MEGLWFRLFAPIRRQWAVATVALLACALAMGSWAVQLPPQFRSTAVISFGPRPGKPVAGSLISLLAPRYVAYASSDFAVRQVTQGAGLAPGTRPRIEVTMPLEETTLTITVTADSRGAATKVARGLSTAVVDRARTDPILNADLIVPARSAVVDGSPRRQLLLAAVAVSLLMGFLAAALVDATVTALRGRQRRDQQRPRRPPGPRTRADVGDTPLGARR